jgi:putative hydrolase of HD superfamily
LRGEKICGKIEKKVLGGADMEPRILLETLAVAERLKDTTRHCYTRKGRHESVAEHCWMMTLMAYFVRDEFPEADMDKVIRMCLIHDLGEAFTGDIPSFDKTAENEKTEERLLRDWVDTLPEFYREEMTSLYGEMEKRETLEAKIYKAIDNLEAVIQHNISDLATWIPKEYELNKTYGDDKVAFSEYLRDLRAEVRRDTERKLGER